MNKIIILIIFYIINIKICFIYSETPEEIFLNELKSYKNNILAIPDDTSIYSPEQKEIIQQYKWSLPKIWIGLESICYGFLNTERISTLKEEINNYLNNNNYLTQENLYNFFKDKIEKKEFSIQNGDITIILPFTENSFKIASMFNSIYSHLDLIWISPEGEPLVFLIHPEGIRKISLARYFMGYFNHNTSIATYRYNKPFDKNRMNTILSKINKNRNNIYYDEAFYKNTNIKNIDTHFNSPQFYYCGELTYTVYRYVLDSDDFSSNHFSSIRELFKNQNVEITPTINFFVSYAEKMETNNNQWIINPTNFYLSDNFSPVIQLSNNTFFKNKRK